MGRRSNKALLTTMTMFPNNNKLSSSTNDDTRNRTCDESIAVSSDVEINDSIPSHRRRNHSSSALPVMLSNYHFKSKKTTVARRKSMSSLPVERSAASLQSSNRRRKYLRRGSKTSRMLRIPLSVSAKMLQQLDRDFRDECYGSWGHAGGSSELSLGTTATTGSVTSSSESGGSGFFLSLNPSTSLPRGENGCMRSTSDVTSTTEDCNGGNSCGSTRTNKSLDLVTIALKEASGSFESATNDVAMLPTKSSRSFCGGKMDPHHRIDTFSDFSNTILKTRLSTASISGASGAAITTSIPPSTPMPSPLSPSTLSHQQQQTQKQGNQSPPPPVPWATPSPPPLQRPSSTSHHHYQRLPRHHHQQRQHLHQENTIQVGQSYIETCNRQQRDSSLSPPSTVELLTSALELSSLHDARDCTMENNNNNSNNNNQ